MQISYPGQGLGKFFLDCLSRPAFSRDFILSPRTFPADFFAHHMSSAGKAASSNGRHKPIKYFLMRPRKHHKSIDNQGTPKTNFFPLNLHKTPLLFSQGTQLLEEGALRIFFNIMQEKVLIFKESFIGGIFDNFIHRFVPTKKEWGSEKKWREWFFKLFFLRKG